MHPLHVESVAWIAERKDVLSGMFWMLTLIAYVEYARRKRWAWFVATLVLLALGLMSKPMLVTLPFVLLLLDYWPLRRFEPRIAESQPPPAVIPLVLEKLPLFLVVAVASVVTFVVQSQARAVVGTTRYPLTLRLANAVVSYATYVRQTIIPHHLAIFYPHVGSLPGRSLSPALVIGSGALLLAITVVAILTRRRAPWVVVGWLWFLGTLIPVIGLVQVGQQAHADRYMYLPMVGVLLMVAFTARQIAGRSPAARTVTAVACVFATIGCTVVTWRQIGTWRNSETVMRHAIDVVPDNYTAHDNLGEYLDSIGAHERARDEYQRALDIKPDDAIALYNLAVYAQSRNDATEAAHLYKRSLQLDPHYAAAWSNYGNLLADQGHAEEAIRAYGEAIKLDPDLPEPYHNLALLLAQQGKIDEAIPLWRRALQIKPDYPAARESLQKALEYQRTEQRKR
jgi:Tfp pilus assembly protein PilF